MLAALIAVVTAGCSPETPEKPDQGPEAVAREVVAEFLEIPMGDITLVSTEAQEFNDSSLGCPEPGMSYLQALTPGHRVIVEADGRRFDVRVSSGYGRICWRKKGAAQQAAPDDDAPAGPPVADLVERARENLARELAVEGAAIVVLDVRPFEAGSSASGCTPECTDGAARCGYLIGLEHDGRRFEYHADGDDVAACPPLLRS